MRPECARTRRTQRLGLLAGSAALLYALLLVRSFELQVVRADELRERQRRQVEQLEEFPALRGEIVDRHGALLATSLSRREVLAEAPHLSQAERRRLVRAIGRITGEDAERVRAKLQRPAPLVRVAYGLDEPAAAQLRAARLPHIRIQPIRLRSYPTREEPHGPSLAAAYVGFAGLQHTGLSGIELAFDDALTGRTLTQAIERDGRRRRKIHAYPSLSERQGDRVTLALDARLQLEAERALADALERTGARSASLLALDPRDGDVLVAAEAPGFDPNYFWLADPGRFRARALQDEFEPGSTLKPFVVAVALEAGVLTETEEIDCGPGRMEIDGRVIRDPKPYGKMTVADALRVSSNICAARIAERLGPHALVGGLRRFGFGARSQSGFPSEASGVVRDPDELRPIELANLAFGQGMRASALQLALAGAVLANGGRRVHPRLALRIGDVPAPSGATQEPVISARTARRVREMLQGVVRDGTGRAAALPHHRVAGKTGTAQKFIDGRYSHEKLSTSFLGIVPADDPRLVVVVTIDEPGSEHTGGSAAAPVFHAFASAAMRVLEVPAEVIP